MIGQWIGTARDADDNILGNIFLNLEKIFDETVGIVCFNTQNIKLLSFKADIFLEDSSNKKKSFKISNFIVYDQHCNVIDDQSLKDNYPNINPKIVVNFECELNEEGVNFNGKWWNATSEGLAEGIKVQQKHQYNADFDEDWSWFKKNVSNYMSREKYIFRGHEDNKYCLNPSFFRYKRYDLFRYRSIDLMELRHHISCITKKTYKFDSQDDFDELLN